MVSDHSHSSNFVSDLRKDCKFKERSFVSYIKGKVIFFSLVLLTDSKKVITDRKVVSNSEILCREMDVRVGRGRGR